MRELDSVRLVRDVVDREGTYVAESTGTVVHVYEDGEAFEVELFHPEHAVVTVERADLELSLD